jgi:hypothetical protein
MYRALGKAVYNLKREVQEWDWEGGALYRKTPQAETFYGRVNSGSNVPRSGR